MPAPARYYIDGNFSTDEGRTWTSFNVALPLLDPAVLQTVTTYYVQITDVSVAFDRNHHFYVVSSEHNAAFTSGAIVLQRFDFSGTVPIQDLTLGHLDPITDTEILDGNTVIYQWFGQDNNGNPIDPAANPVMGIDDNDPSFTDPSHRGSAD